LAWLFYGRRCRYCGKKISFRYPAMEIATAVLFALAFLKYNIGISFFIVLLLMGYFIVVTMIDYDFQVIPDSINWPFFFVGLIIHGLLGYFAPGLVFENINVVFSLKTSLFGALAGGGLLWLIAVLSNGGMGMGDVKFALAIGSFLGPVVTLQVLFISFFLGAFFGIFFILLRIKKRKDYIPFGPYIAAAAVIVILAGSQNISKLYWYLMFIKIKTG
jgi:leader peptidase (prepilin peptidase)/N-methyltransferase